MFKVQGSKLKLPTASRWDRREKVLVPTSVFTQHFYQAFLLFPLLCVIVLFLGGCSPTWRHPARGQGDLAKDLAECEVLAQEEAVAVTMTGRKPDPITYERAWRLCLMKKGWRTEAEAAEAVDGPPPQPLAQPLASNAFEFAGEKVELPPLTKVVKESLVPGTIISQLINFTGQMGALTYQGELVFQKISASSDLEFLPVLHAMANPAFFTYAKGPLPNGSQWRAFAGDVGDNTWIGGVGVFWRLSKKERIVVTFRAPLPQLSPETPPPAHLRMSEAQAAALDQLTAHCLPWLESLGSPPLELGFGRWYNFIFTLGF